MVGIMPDGKRGSNGLGEWNGLIDFGFWILDFGLRLEIRGEEAAGIRGLGDEEGARRCD
jgi:hypothetical protein